MLKRLSVLTCLGCLLFTSVTSADVAVESSGSFAVGAGAAVNQAQTTLADFDVGAGDKLVVGFAVENGQIPDFGVSYDGIPLTQVIASSDFSGVETAALFFLDGASGIGDIVVTTGTGTGADMPILTGNGPGIFAASLSGAALGGPEVFGANDNSAPINGTLTQTITGASDGAYVISVFGDQGQAGARTVGGDLLQVSTFNGANGVQIGSGSAVVAAGFGDGTDLTVSFSDVGNTTDFNSRSHLVFASFAPAAVPEPSSIMLLTGLCGLVVARRRRR